MSNRDWDGRRFGDIASLEYGSALPASTRVGDEFPVFGSNGEIGRHRAALVRGPGIVVGRKGTVGALVWSEDDFWPIDTAYYVETRPDIDKRWLYWVMQTLGLGRLDSSTGVPGLNRNDAYELALRIPRIEEQRRIAELLDTLDCRIRLAGELVNRLRLQADGLLDDLILDLSEERREPLATACIADICYGIVQSGEFVAHGVPVLSIRDLNGDFETRLHRTNPAIDAQYRRSRVAPGDVLLSIKGTIGRVGVAPEHYVGNISREIARLRFGSRVLPEFARLYFLSREAQRRLDLSVVGTTRAEVSIHVLKRFDLPVPSLAHQERMLEAYRCIQQRIVAEKQELLKLESMKLGLARDLLTGRVRVPVKVSS